MTALTFIAWFIGVSASLSLVMALAWLVWRRTRNSGWVDATWTFGLGGIGAFGALLSIVLSGADDRSVVRPALVAIFILGWTVRLGAHIARRSTTRKDDPRYAKLQREWGPNAERQMFWLLQKQALVSIPLAMSMLLAALNPVDTVRLQDALGVALIVAGIVGEAISDRQLRRFGDNPSNAGRVCDIGLWHYSRHPNYFFEWLGWLFYPLCAIDLTGSYPFGWLAIAGPMAMYWLLVHVSGIPPLEAHLIASRGDAFRAYQTRTSAFFPAPRRG